MRAYLTLRTSSLLLALSLGACTGLIDGSLLGAAEDTEENGAGSGETGGDPAGNPGGQPIDEVEVSEEELKLGKEHYDAQCANCHGADGQGGPFNVPLTRDVGLASLIETIDDDMPLGSAELCVGECARLVGQYVYVTFVVPAVTNPNPGAPALDCRGEEPGPRLLRMLTRREYRNTVRDLLGVAAPDTDSVPVEPRVRGYDNNAAASVITSRHVDEYARLAEQVVPAALAASRAQLVPCDEAEAGCARTFIERFGERAFRRPLSAEELADYEALFAGELTQGSFDTGVDLAMRAMLISPSFLYRSEVGEPQGDGTFRLTQHEIANALSYTFWGSMPDDALFEAAKNGQLSTREQLEAQARRLLDDPRAREQVSEMAVQWLRTDSLIGSNKDKVIYPTFTDDVREAMFEEQRRFIEHLFFDTAGTYEELLLADYVFVNPALAQFYGVQTSSQGFSQVTVAERSGRGGILGLGSVLASHAHSNESSPIKRGLFVRDRLLCQDLPAPPANLDTTPPGLDPTLTTRERFAQHTADPACASCHQFIDGVGFGLEGYDGVGALRLEENGIDVDTSGELVGLDSLTGTDRHAFDGARGLAEVLAQSDRAASCMALQVFRFTRGYEEKPVDACSIDTLTQRFAASDNTLLELLVSLTGLDSFVIRK